MSDEANSITRQTPLSAVLDKTKKPKPPAKPAPPPTVDKAKPPVTEGRSTSIDGPTEDGRRAGGKSTSVYFSSKRDLEYLAALQNFHPRASVSNIMSQLLQAFVKQASSPEGITNNSVELPPTKVFL